MKASDLRIGNLFIDNKTKTIISVIGLTEEIITFSGHFKNDWQAEPIPLTEEWLLKFGFNKFQGMFVKTLRNGYQMMIDKTGTDSGNFRLIANDINGITYFKHVHQLQNLYHSLTGEELTIKKN